MEIAVMIEWTKAEQVILIKSVLAKEPDTNEKFNILYDFEKDSAYDFEIIESVRKELLDNHYNTIARSWRRGTGRHEGAFNEKLDR